jgi:hypothetical protein
MSQIHSLHLADHDAPSEVKGASDGNRMVATIVTLAIVLVAGGGVFYLMSREGPAPAPAQSSVPGAPPEAESSPVAGEALSPAPAPAAAEAPSVVPAGTKLALEIVEPATSTGAEVGTRIVAKLASPVMIADDIAIDAGTQVVGRVTEAGTSGTTVAGVAFESIEIDGQSTPIVAELEGQELDLAAGRQIEFALAQAIDLPAEPADAVEPASAPGGA